MPPTHLTYTLSCLISIFLVVLTTACILELPTVPGQTSPRSFQITSWIAYYHCSLDVPRVILKLTCQPLSHIILPFLDPSPPNWSIIHLNISGAWYNSSAPSRPPKQHSWFWNSSLHEKHLKASLSPSFMHRDSNSIVQERELGMCVFI